MTYFLLQEKKCEKIFLLLIFILILNKKVLKFQKFLQKPYCPKGIFLKNKANYFWKNWKQFRKSRPDN